MAEADELGGEAEVAAPEGGRDLGGVERPAPLRPTRPRTGAGCGRPSAAASSVASAAVDDEALVAEAHDRVGGVGVGDERIAGGRPCVAPGRRGFGRRAAARRRARARRTARAARRGRSPPARSTTSSSVRPSPPSASGTSAPSTPISPSAVHAPAVRPVAFVHASRTAAAGTPSSSRSRTASRNASWSSVNAKRIAAYFRGRPSTRSAITLRWISLVPA